MTKKEMVSTLVQKYGYEPTQFKSWNLEEVRGLFNSEAEPQGADGERRPQLARFRAEETDPRLEKLQRFLDIFGKVLNAGGRDLLEKYKHQLNFPKCLEKRKRGWGKKAPYVVVKDEAGNPVKSTKGFAQAAKGFGTTISVILNPYDKAEKKGEATTEDIADLDF